jgi:hypothetical protein
MMYSMYCDPVKNIVMFLPDGTSDAEVLSLGALTLPVNQETLIKPVGFIDLYNAHATYSPDKMAISDFTMIL